MTTTLPTAEQVCDLPDDLREPLHSLNADIRYLFGRVAADGTLASMMADSAVSRLSQIEEASYRLNAHITAQAAEIERLMEELGKSKATLSAYQELDKSHIHTCESIMARSVTRAEAAEVCLAAVTVERDAMRAALEPFANAGRSMDEAEFDMPDDDFIIEDGGYGHLSREELLTFGDFRRARAALSLDAQVKREAEPDWWYRTLDPDDAGDSPHEALRNVPDFTVCELLSSYSGPKKFAFRAPTLDPNDDTETLLFDTQEEALAAATERHAVLDAQEEKE